MDAGGALALLARQNCRHDDIGHVSTSSRPRSVHVRVNSKLHIHCTSRVAGFGDFADADPRSVT